VTTFLTVVALLGALIVAIIVSCRAAGNFNKRALSGVFAAYRLLMVFFFGVILYHVSLSCYHFIASGLEAESQKHLDIAFDMLERPRVILVFVLIEFVFSNIQRVIDALKGVAKPESQG